MLKCIACTSILRQSQKTYCSNKCQGNYAYQRYIAAWKEGTVDGGRGISTRAISSHIRRYLFEKYKGTCALCGWGRLNPITKNSPLEIDHIDGNSENNNENNLQLICPNCHALTTTYKNSNRGHGRSWRRLKYIKVK